MPRWPLISFVAKLIEQVLKQKNTRSMDMAKGQEKGKTKLSTKEKQDRKKEKAKNKKEE